MNVGTAKIVIGPANSTISLEERDQPGGARPRALGLRILFVEASPPQVELTERTLRAAGLVFSFVAVDRREDFELELRRRPPDLILSDYLLPGFDGSLALEVARKQLPNTPFIFVTGVLGEEVAIEMLKLGATDCVLKTHLSRLVPSVRRALREGQERRERERAEENLRSSHEQLRALTGHLQSVREEERTRIAREVHDELGQALTGLKLDLSWLSGKLRGARGLQRRIKAMSAQIDATIHTVRRIATELRPGILDSLGLVAAIEWQASDFQQRTGISCAVSIDIAEMLVEPTLTTVCFRIFQETLTNIIRHAKATRVEVRLAQSEDSLVLTVRDNGLGISEREINARSIGLIGMKERVAQVGGELFFFGLPGQGTTVTMRAAARAVGSSGKGGIMRILIADDHAVVRRGIKQILSDAFKHATFGEASNGREALEQVRSEPWNVVVLDVTMPGQSGLEVLKEIKESRPNLPVVMLSMHPEDQFAVRLLKAGASGYMNKESAPAELVGAVRKAMAGGRYVSPALAEKMAELLSTDAQVLPHERLSDREFLILRLIASGKPVGTIARELGLSVKTVSTYRTRVLQKMNLANNAELTHYAFQHQLVVHRAGQMGVGSLVSLK